MFLSTLFKRRSKKKASHPLIWRGKRLLDAIVREIISSLQKPWVQHDLSLLIAAVLTLLVFSMIFKQSMDGYTAFIFLRCFS